MDVLHHFDGGVPAPFDIVDDQVTFDLRPDRHVLHVLLRGTRPGVRVSLNVGEKTAQFVADQGLLVSRDGLRYEALPFDQSAPGRLSVGLDEGGDVYVATAPPYGRDNLDRLLTETRTAPDLAVRLLGSGGRATPLFLFGREAAGRPVHWFIGGEDAWECAGSWVADAMVRELASGGDLARRLLDRAAVRIVPLPSPYSATQPAASYTTLEGRGLYAAATWGDGQPPPEFARLRDEVVSTVRQGRLGLLLTIHSWHAARDLSGMEFIRTAGATEITGARLEWAKQTLETLIRGVPKGRAHVAEKIWHPGLARDYLLAEHGAVTFRIEITTCGQLYQGFAGTARHLLENTAAVTDWGPALPR